MTINSSLFNACATGNGEHASALERERAQHAENGLLGLMHMVTQDEENTAKGRQKKANKEREHLNHTVAQIEAMKEAMDRLNSTMESFNTDMDEMNDRLENRIEAIDAKLNDPSLSDAERQKLEQERQQLIIIQQQMLDDHQALQDRYDDIQDRIARGEEVDPKEIDDLEKEIQDTQKRFEADIGERIPHTNIVPQSPVQNGVSLNTDLSF